MKKTLVLVMFFITTCLFSQTTAGSYTVENLDSNSKNSDFGTTFYGEDQIIFSSSRGAGVLQKKWKENNQPFLDLYIGTVNEDGSVAKVKNFSSTLNSKYHESSVSFTPDQKIVYFTRNNEYNENLNKKVIEKEDKQQKEEEEEKKKKERKKKKEKIEKTTYLAIYRADVNDTGQWTNIESLPFNNRNYSVGHPAVNRDGTKLYFTSDMPGAYGSTDIFVVDILDEGKYSKPKNLGRKINTLGREMFPYIDSKNNLYFSSDSRKGGLGALDIYAVKIYDNNSISSSLHLGEPINSEEDDFGLILNNDTNQGYFSSNRDKGKGDDDIYHFIASPPLNIGCTQSITGVVKNTKTSKPISNAVVVLLDEKGNEQQTFKTKRNGIFKIEAPCDGTYKIIASKNDFEKDEEEFTTENNPDTELELTLNLKPISKCVQNISGIVKDIKTTKPISNVLISILNNKGKEVETFKTDINGRFNTALPCESDYKALGSKDKYENDEKGFVTGTNPNEKIELALSLKLKPDLTEIKIVKDKVIVNIDPIYFELNKENITEEAAIELNKVVTIMNKYPKLKIEGGSHTDTRGTGSYNLDLSTKRANSTVEYIINQGINSSRIKAKGYGETRPANHCLNGVRCSDAEHKQNRRTEFVILNPEVLGYY